jgi:hypothetical protein
MSSNVVASIRYVLKIRSIRKPYMKFFAQSCFLPRIAGRRPRCDVVKSVPINLPAILSSSCRSMFVVAVVFMFMNAAVLAELCSALPVSGSIYIWAAQSAGPKYARFVGFIVAWWSCTAWMIFTANVSQV